MVLNQLAVSLGIGCPPIFADSKASTWRVMDPAVLRSHFPRRIVLRLQNRQEQAAPKGSHRTLVAAVVAAGRERFEQLGVGMDASSGRI